MQKILLYIYFFLKNFFIHLKNKKGGQVGRGDASAHKTVSLGPCKNLTGYNFDPKPIYTPTHTHTIHKY